MELDVSVPRRDLLGVSGLSIDWSPPPPPNIMFGNEAGVLQRGPNALRAPCGKEKMTWHRRKNGILPCSCLDWRSLCPHCPSPPRSSSSLCGLRTRCLATSVEGRDTLGSAGESFNRHDKQRPMIIYYYLLIGRQHWTGVAQVCDVVQHVLLDDVVDVVDQFCRGLGGVGQRFPAPVDLCKCSLERRRSAGCFPILPLLVVRPRW